MKMKVLIFNCLMLYMDLSYQIIEMCKLLKRTENYLSTQMRESGMRHVACGLNDDASCNYLLYCHGNGGASFDND